jgi:hypothetical protein
MRWAGHVARMGEMKDIGGKARRKKITGKAEA